VGPRRILGAVLVTAACQAPAGNDSSFGTGSRITTADGGESTHAESTGGSTGGADEDGGPSGGSDETTGPARDLPVPDFGDGAPAGCKGKIDFLFMISRHGLMYLEQERLIEAFPEFIHTIETRFADFDYHIMVVDGDGGPDGGQPYDTGGWGDYWCNAACPDLSCKAGEDCCPTVNAENVGDPCCLTPEYPCDEIHQLDQCDWAWGAGTVFPAGRYTENRRCPIDGGRRYLVTGQTDLLETFSCVAAVGVDSAAGALGQGLTAAMQPEMNAPGGCNKGFVRDDALLMVTLIDRSVDYKVAGSEGYPFQWAEAVRKAKHGDDRSVVMLQIGPDLEACHPQDRICELVQMFPNHLRVGAKTADYGAAFAEAAEMVETACAGFVPPG
jgi:hypothetical protein